MNGQPPVSIFIMTYLDSEERCAFLKRACESALSQRYPDFEVVISENPGPYQARDALASIRDVRLKIVRAEENEGFTGNINRCVDLCSHDIIKPLCDDDLIHPDFLTYTVPWVDDDTMVVVGWEQYDLGQNPSAMEQPVAKPLEEVDVREAGYGFDIWSLPHAPSSSGLLFTRKLFCGLGKFDVRTPPLSDYDFLQETSLYHKLVLVNRTLCYDGVWPGSLTVSMTETPFFFPVEALYTKFRICYCKPLTVAERRRILRMLLGQFFWQSLRPLKHPFNKVYWTGYLDYIQRFSRFWRGEKSMFTPRPKDPEPLKRR